MKTTLFIFLSTLSIGAYSQSLDEYPRKAIIENDTVAILHIDQVRTINERLIDLKMTSEELNELKKINDLYKLSNKSLENQVDLMDKEIINLNKQIKNYKEINENVNKMYNKQKRKTKIIGGVAITLGITSALLLLVK